MSLGIADTSSSCQCGLSRVMRTILNFVTGVSLAMDMSSRGSSPEVVGRGERVRRAFAGQPGTQKRGLDHSDILWTMLALLRL